MRDDLLDEMEMFPYNDEEKSLSYMSPSPSSYEKYLEHIDGNLAQDTPTAFGMHPNAEIDFRTTQSNRILLTIMELQPRDAGLISVLVLAGAPISLNEHKYCLCHTEGLIKTTPQV